MLNEFKRKLVSIFCSFYCRIIFSSNNLKYSYKKLKMCYLLWLSSFCIFEMLCPLARLKYTLIYLNVCIIDEQFINNKNSFLHYIIFNICICLKHLNLQKLVFLLKEIIVFQTVTRHVWSCIEVALYTNKNL